MARLEDGVVTSEDVLQGRHGPIPVRRYQPSAPRATSLLWLHGGGFSSGGLDQLESHAVAASLAQRGIPVVTVDYRLAPPWWGPAARAAEPAAGVRYPVPLDDVLDAYAAIRLESGALDIGGASAGACLAAAAVLRMRDEQAGLPERVVLAYGTYHASLPDLPPHVRSRVAGVHGVIQFRRRTVAQMNTNYVGGEAGLAEPYAFPGGKDLSGFPSTLILDADRDTLRASGDAFAAELTAAGSNVTYRVVRGSTHGFLDRPRRAHFARGIDEIGRWLTGA